MIPRVKFHECQTGKILYSWKLLENLAPNCGLQVLPDSEKSRQGRRLKVPEVNQKAPTKRRLEQVFQLNGPKLFHSLPAKIGNLTSKKGIGLEDFKQSLDQYLENVPDQPKIDGLTPGSQNYSRVFSNSILYQTKPGTMGGGGGRSHGT